MIPPRVAGVRYIYALTDPDTEQLRYIGQTVDLQDRYKCHLTSFCGDRNRKDRWIKELQAAGKKPGLIVVETVAVTDADEREQHWIDHYRAQGVDLLNGVKCEDPRGMRRNKPDDATVRIDRKLWRIIHTRAGAAGISCPAWLNQQLAVWLDTENVPDPKDDAQ